MHEVPSPPRRELDRPGTRRAEHLQQPDLRGGIRRDPRHLAKDFGHLGGADRRRRRRDRDERRPHQAIHVRVPGEAPQRGRSKADRIDLELAGAGDDPAGKPLRVILLAAQHAAGRLPAELPDEAVKRVHLSSRVRRDVGERGRSRGGAADRHREEPEREDREQAS